jgi:small subunit ribosomal protein S6
MNRNYELMFIIRPDIPDEEADRLISTLEGIATQSGATLKKTERIGKRRLAYRVRGFKDGNYVLFDIDSGPQPVKELERRLRVAEPVIKYLTVRLDELDKRVGKDRAQREARLKRKPAQPQPAPAAPEFPSVPVEEPGTAPAV